MNKVIFAFVNANNPFVVNVLAFIIGLAFAFGIVALDAVILMAVWNIVMPAIFVSITTISFWQAMGLWLICDILFKSSVSVIKS